MQVGKEGHKSGMWVCGVATESLPAYSGYSHEFDLDSVCVWEEV